MTAIMAQGQLLMIVLLSCVGQLFAIRYCNDSISAQVSAMPQPPVSYIKLLSGQQVYLVSATPDAEFSATDSYFLDFNVSCGEAVVFEQSQTFVNGSSKCRIHAVIKESNTDYYYEPGYDFYLNLFICRGGLNAAYKCKPNACGQTLFLILAPYGSPPAQDAVDSCKEDIRSILPSARFKDMNYPQRNTKCYVGL